MRSEEQVYNTILNFAKADERIRMVTLQGSFYHVFESLSPMGSKIFTEKNNWSECFNRENLLNLFKRK